VCTLPVVRPSHTAEHMALQEVLATGNSGPPQGAALRRAAFNLLLFGCRQSGAAFIKWGQWASSRPDLLPEVPLHVVSCKYLEAMHPGLDPPFPPTVYLLSGQMSSMLKIMNGGLSSWDTPHSSTC
jgi:hypothetical protein